MLSEIYTQAENWLNQDPDTETQTELQQKISKKNKFGGFTISDFKTYYKNTAIKAMWVWLEDRHSGQWERTGSP